MPPRPPSRSYAQILADSPLLDADRARALFPSDDHRRRLEDLGRILDHAAASNLAAAQTWAALADLKETVIGILRLVVGR